MVKKEDFLKRTIAACAIIGVVIIVIMLCTWLFSRGEELAENPTPVPTPAVTATVKPTPTNKPDYIWDKPTTYPTGTDVDITINPSDKDKDNVENREDESINYDDYISVDKDGTVTIDFDAYTEDLYKEDSEEKSN